MEMTCTGKWTDSPTAEIQQVEYTLEEAEIGEDGAWSCPAGGKVLMLVASPGSGFPNLTLHGTYSVSFLPVAPPLQPEGKPGAAVGTATAPGKG